MSDNNPLDPMRLTIEQAAKLLSATYRERIEVRNIEADIKAGAPTNADGTINLVNYASWQAKELARAD